MRRRGSIAWVPVVGLTMLTACRACDEPLATPDAAVADAAPDGPSANCPAPPVAPPVTGGHVAITSLTVAGPDQIRYVGAFTQVSDLAAVRQEVMESPIYQLGLELRAADCATTAVTSWKLTGPVGSPPVVTRVVSTTTCGPAQFADLRAGVYDVEATRTVDGCQRTYRAQAEVFPKVVIGIGDSYGAGEGLPPYALPACHRGEGSLQGQIVRRAFDAVPAAQRRPVLFFHAACSAASSEQLFGPQTTPYDVNGNIPLMGNQPIVVPSQLESVRAFMELFGDGAGPAPRPRHPDAVLVTMGGNDLSFTGYLVSCIKNTARADLGQGTYADVSICLADSPYPESRAESQRIADVATLSLSRLPGNHATLARCLTQQQDGTVWVGPGTLEGIDQHELEVTCPLSVPITADKVFLTSYVNGLRGPNGWCNAIGTPWANLDPPQSEWLSVHIATPLEQTMRSSAAAQCWRLISIFDADVAGGHGICAPDDAKWIYPIVWSALSLVPGRMVHPNPAGAAAYAAAESAEVAKQLAGTQALATTVTDGPCVCAAPPPPAFVGTSSPSAGAEVDWAAMDAEQVTYTQPAQLMFTAKIPHDPGNSCGEIEFELPTPCGAGYTDYIAWRLGGAVGVVLFPPGVPSIFNSWVFNPGYFAEGMMDPFYDHPAKNVIVGCQGGGANYCGFGSYGPGTDDHSLIPSDLARQDPAPGPAQPGIGAYDGRIRAFPVYTRAAPDPSLPAGYQLCFDRIHLAAQGGGIPVACQSNDGREHGAIYITFQAACAP